MVEARTAAAVRKAAAVDTMAAAPRTMVVEEDAVKVAARLRRLLLMSRVAVRSAPSAATLPAATMTVPSALRTEGMQGRGECD